MVVLQISPSIRMFKAFRELLFAPTFLDSVTLKTPTTSIPANITVGVFTCPLTDRPDSHPDTVIPHLLYFHSV